MRLSYATTAVREKLNDGLKTYWSDVDIARWLSHHNNSLFRRRVNADRSYGFRQFAILGTDTSRVQTVKSDQYRYWFPSWVYRIYGLRETEEQQTRRASLIDYVEWPRDQHAGWFFSGDRHIDLIRFSKALDIDFEVTKLPGPLHVGTIEKVSAAVDEIYLDPDPVDAGSPSIPFQAYEVTFEDGAYLGMELGITTPGDDMADNRREVHVIETAVNVWDSGLSKRLIQCTVFPAFETEPQVDDTYELHLALDQSALELVSSLTARSLFDKTKNLEGIATCTQKILEEMPAFIDSLRPRQEQVPGFMGLPENQSGFFDPNKDFSGEVFG